MAVVGVAAYLLIGPAAGRVEDARSRAISTNNLKQIGIGLHAYHGDHNAFPPPDWVPQPERGLATKPPRPTLSWRVAILPYVEQMALYNQFHLDEPWDSPHNMQFVRRMPKTYALPGDEFAADCGTARRSTGPSSAGGRRSSRASR